MMKKRLLFGTLASCSIGVIAYTSTNDEIKSLGHASYRIGNLVMTAAMIAYDYKFSAETAAVNQISGTLNNLRIDIEKKQKLQVENVREFYALKKKGENTQELQKKMDDIRNRINTIAEQIALVEEKTSVTMASVHKRNAARLLKMCAQNEGVYIKLGQHLAMLDYVIPKEFQEQLLSLLDQTPRSSWETVLSVLEADLGTEAILFFESIERDPIASASLAQVHVARGKDGKKYAVKVQHAGLREGSTSDRIAITFVIDILSRIFPDFNYTWLTREMNRNLPQELDFRIEVANIKRSTSCLQPLIDTGAVALPKVEENLCSDRILTMSFEEGCYATDLDGIRRAGLRPSDVAKLISTIFSEQMYRHGFVHCDPHDANMLVRPNPKNKGRPQIVLLDHGLYRDLEPDFRQSYTRLWNGIITSNVDDIRKYSLRLGAGDLYPLLAAMLTMKPWDDIISDDTSRLKLRGTNGEKILLKFYAEKYFKQINTLLGAMPSDMLLLLKTNDCLRHLDTKLGTPINTTMVVANTVADVMLKEDLWTWWNTPKIVEDAVIGQSNNASGAAAVEAPAQLTLTGIASSYLMTMSRAVGLSMIAGVLHMVGGWWRV